MWLSGGSGGGASCELLVCFLVEMAGGGGVEEKKAHGGGRGGSWCLVLSLSSGPCGCSLMGQEPGERGDVLLGSVVAASAGECRWGWSLGPEAEWEAMFRQE